MFSKTLAIVSALAALPSTFALPEVIAKELPATCESYPGYNADTGIAGPWTIELKDSDNTAIEGFGAVSTYSIKFDPSVDRKPSMRWGHIVINTRNGIARRAIECVNSTLSAYVDTDLKETGEPTNTQWMPVVLSPYHYDGSLLYKIDGEPVKIYEHYVGDEKQDGVFLGGYDGTTTWGVKYYPADAGSYDQDYFYLRLIPAGQELQTNETKTFLTINA